MSVNENKLSFEEAYSKLQQASAAISDDRVPLEKAIESYKEGKKYYSICRGILDEAKQLVELYDKENGEVQEL